MKKVFIFGFSLENEENEDDSIFVQYELPLISGNNVEKIKSFSDVDHHISNKVFDKIQEITDDLEEEYGVHDWETSERDDDVVEVIGYDTYEVPEEDIPKLLETWKKRLILIGFTVGNWELIEN